MTPRAPTLLIAEDGLLLRKSLERLLKSMWPALVVVARAGNGAKPSTSFRYANRRSVSSTCICRA